MKTVQTGDVMLAEATYQAVRDRQQREPGVVEPVLALLADPDHHVEVTDDMRRMAVTLADQREAGAVDEFLEGALPTSEVIDRVRSWNDRRTVASARRRRQLLGLTVGRETYHPAWQFTRSGVRQDLGVVIGPLLEASADDPVLADEIMRTPRPELDGRSLADLLASRRTPEVLTLLAHYRDGYTA
jgi:hypothetical protein